MGMLKGMGGGQAAPVQAPAAPAAPQQDAMAAVDDAMASFDAYHGSDGGMGPMGPGTPAPEMGPGMVSYTLPDGQKVYMAKPQEIIEYVGDNGPYVTSDTRGSAAHQQDAENYEADRARQQSKYEAGQGAAPSFFDMLDDLKPYTTNKY